METRSHAVGIFSRQARELRVIGIVLTHMRAGPDRFRVVADPAREPVDLAIVDGDDPEMRVALARALEHHPHLPTIHLVRFAGQSGTPHELMPGQLMSGLLPMMHQVLLAAPKHEPNPPAELAEIPGAAATDPAAPLAPLNALVVDDSPTVRTQLSNVVHRFGLHCQTAADAASALALLAQQSFDIIYVDVVMPEMDGYQLTRAIKRDPRHKRTPVVILTSQSSPFDRARGALAGCNHFLVKPVGLGSFYEATAKVLRKAMAVEDLSPWLISPERLPVKGADLAARPGNGRDRPILGGQSSQAA